MAQASEMGTDLVTMGGMLDQSVMLELGSAQAMSDVSAETDDEDEEGGINDLLLTGDLDFDQSDLEEDSDEVRVLCFRGRGLGSPVQGCP